MVSRCNAVSTIITIPGAYYSTHWEVLAVQRPAVTADVQVSGALFADLLQAACLCPLPGSLGRQ